MASFTDIIPQFNPYIQQLPVEAMVSVGMEKQRRYDEGLQKIQGQIDRIAGLDIIQPEQRKYLQSKLDELGNNLKTVAAGDFSNFQLVNSVGDMANQIGKDSRILNAVSSTKAYRKALQDKETYTKEGKSSASNDWDFAQQANSWLNGDVDASFSGTYNPYTNYRKNALEVIKALTKNKTITEDAFDFDKNGRMIIKDAIVREELSGISPEQIQEALMAGLTPNDWKQIEIDGRYNYSNVPPSDFVKSIESTYKNNVDAFNKQRTILENAKSSTSSAVEKAALDNKIKAIDKVLGKINGEYGSISKMFASGNIEAAKAQLFTNNFMNTFSNAFSFTETTQEYKSNPLAQAEQWRQNKDQEWKKIMLDYNLGLANLQVRKEELAEKREANRIARLGVEGYGPIAGPVDANTLPKVALDTVVGQTNSYLQGVQKMDSDFAASQGKDQAWLNQQKEAYLKSPNGVDPVVKQHFDNTQGARRLAEENQVMVTQIASEADRRFGTIDKYIPKTAPNLTYRDGKGNIYTYTPTELVNFNSKLKNYKPEVYKPSPDRPGAPSLSTTYDDEKAKKELSPKEYLLYEISKAGTKNTGANKVIWENLKNYDKNVNAVYGKVIAEKNNFIGEEVKRRLLAAQGVSYSIPTGTKEQKESLAGIFSSIADMADKQGGIALSPGLDKDVLRKLAESGDVEANITVIEGTEFAPTMYQVTARGKAGTTTFNLTPEQKRLAFQDRFEPSPAVRAFRPYQAMMQKYSSQDPTTGTTSNFLSTNPTKGPITFQNSSLNSTDFPGIKSYGVTGAVISNDGGKTYSVRFNLYDPITRTFHNDIPYFRMLSEEEVVPVMSQITDAAVYELLNDGKKATKAQLELLQRASKKPL
jgi:hypothetical protein